MKYWLSIVLVVLIPILCSQEKKAYHSLTMENICLYVLAIDLYKYMCVKQNYLSCK